MITFNNYYNGTKGIFKGCKVPKRKPNYVSKSKQYNTLSSRYWYGQDSKGMYVIRESDHWVNYYNQKGEIYFSKCNCISSCFWSIKSVNNSRLNMCGKIYLKDFKKVLFRNI